MTPAPLTGRFDDALAYARQLHAGQRRKGTTIPYLAHLLSVAALVLEHSGDEDQAIAGLLHDAVEDQGGQTGPRGDPPALRPAGGRNRPGVQRQRRRGAQPEAAVAGAEEAVSGAPTPGAGEGGPRVGRR